MISDESYTTMDSKSVLCSVVGWQLSRTRNDTMHCVNLGVAHHVIANALVFLCTNRAYRSLGVAVQTALGPMATTAEVLFDLFLRFKVP